MTVISAPAGSDFVALSVTGGFAQILGLATERVQLLESLDTVRLAALLGAIRMAGFFTRAVGDTPTPPDART